MPEPFEIFLITLWTDRGSHHTRICLGADAAWNAYQEGLSDLRRPFGRIVKVDLEHATVPRESFELVASQH